MGANGATKLLRVAENLEKILAIELFTSIQALEFRRPLRSSAQLEDIVKSFREIVPFINDDKVMYTEIEKSIKFIRTIDWRQMWENQH
jgi:histidine ammonia-lyase